MAQELIESEFRLHVPCPRRIQSCALKRRANRYLDRGMRGQEPTMHVINSLVRLVDVINSQDGKVAVVTGVAEGDTRPSLEPRLVNGGLGGVQSDGHREDVSVSKTRIGDDAK